MASASEASSRLLTLKASRAQVAAKLAEGRREAADYRPLVPQGGGAKA